MPHRCNALARLVIVLAVLASAFVPATAQQTLPQVTARPAEITLPDGRTSPFFLSTQGRLLVEATAPAGSPLPVLSMPFQRLHSAPIRLKALGPTPKSFVLNRPALATTYRIVVPCDVNVRVLGTMTEGEAVTEDTGVLYLAGTDVTMGTSRPNFISAMTIGTPTGECTPEMHYGVGGG